MNKCERCGKYYFDEVCYCQPFEIIHEDYVDEPMIIYAISPEHAAEAYAQEFNEDGDYAMMQGCNSIQITVDGDPYTVTAEPTIEYHVSEGH